MDLVPRAHRHPLSTSCLRLPTLVLFQASASARRALASHTSSGSTGLFVESGTGHHSLGTHVAVM